MRKFKFAKLFTSTTILLVALGYLLLIWHENYASVNGTISKIESGSLILPVIISIIAGLINALLWFKINKDIKQEVNFKKSYWAWSVSRIFRYIPGKFFSYYIRNRLQESSMKSGVIASFNEFILVLLPLLILVIIHLILIEDSILFSSFIFCGFLLLFFCRPILSSAQKFYKVNRLPISSLYTPRGITAKFKLIIPAMLLHGTSFYLIIKFSLNENEITFLQTIITLYVSGIIGQLAIISPGGLGVREASIVLFLITFGSSSEVAVASAFLSRVTLFLGEISNIVLAFIYKQVK